MMQTILGAGGQIATELARELRRTRTDDVRLVSRTPRAVHEHDELVSADLTSAEQTQAAVAGSDTVYFTAGLPADTDLWERQFVPMVRNALDAARSAHARFVYFDNTYMYPQDGRVLTEDTPFAPVGRKGRVRATLARMVLDEIARGDIPAMIARAPEFYGPGRTQSFTNTLVIDRLMAGAKARIPVRADRLRSLIWTPDASRALATLGSTDDAYGQTWHLPVSPDRLTYDGFVSLAEDVLGTDAGYSVIPAWLFRARGLVSASTRELGELLTRYAHDNIFDTTKFAGRFPEFAVTTYRAGLEHILAGR